MSGAAVELWVAPIPAPLTGWQARACSAVLAEDERRAAARFRPPGRRDQALVARALVRRALSRRLGRPPGDLCFERSPYGRPRLAGGGTPDFNLAHAEGCVVLAIADAGRIGVDVEPFARARDIAAVAGRVLAGPEIAALDALDPEERDRRLVRLWTLKEAWAKARGGGLAIDFRTLVIEADGDRFRLASETDICLASFDAAPAHGVAVAVDGPVDRIDRRDALALLFD